MSFSTYKLHGIGYGRKYDPTYRYGNLSSTPLPIASHIEPTLNTQPPLRPTLPLFYAIRLVFLHLCDAMQKQILTMNYPHATITIRLKIRRKMEFFLSFQDRTRWHLICHDVTGHIGVRLWVECCNLSLWGLQFRMEGERVGGRCWSPSPPSPFSTFP